MQILISSSSDPYWNLATEEYLLKNSSEDFIYLYVNKPCVVVGKHQNTQKEINSRFTFNNNILLCRRLSGGGAVYHDEGNLNFSYIRTVAFGENISYQGITQSIFAFLKHLVPSITLSERNDFLLDGSKISGSAMHVFKNRVMAHCTLLVDCDLTNLSTSLKGEQHRFMDKAIASVRSKVTNLNHELKNISVKSFLNEFTSYLKIGYSNVELISMPEEANEPIRKLATGKYATPEWIFGYSPRYTYTNSVSYQGKIIHYSLDVEKGTIARISFESNDEVTEYISLLLNSLEGRQHHIFALQKRLNSTDTKSFDHALLNSLL